MAELVEEIEAWLIDDGPVPGCECEDCEDLAGG